VELAFMRVTAPRSVDENGPILFLNGGPGDNSLYYAEQLVAHPHIRDVVVDRDWIFLDQRGTNNRDTHNLPRCQERENWDRQRVYVGSTPPALTGIHASRRTKERHLTNCGRFPAAVCTPSSENPIRRDVLMS
jgi:pimeloyl-ACP methyl ester carboxylesterase